MALSLYPTPAQSMLPITRLRLPALLFPLTGAPEIHLTSKQWRLRSLFSDIFTNPTPLQNLATDPAHFIYFYQCLLSQTSLPSTVFETSNIVAARYRSIPFTTNYTY